MNTIRRLFLLVAIVFYGKTLLPQSSAYQKLSLIMTDLETGETFVNKNGDQLLTPASITKLITTATALEILGDDFTFKTTVQIDGVLENGIVRGNLIIKAGGDPLLGSHYLENTNFLSTWSSILKTIGIKHIEGDIVADVSVFDNKPMPKGWCAPDLGNYYAAGVYGLSFCNNMLRVTFKSGKTGTRPKIVGISPQIYGMKIDNRLIAKRGAGDCASFVGEPYSNIRKAIGYIEANKKNFTIKADIGNPPMALLGALRDTLLRNGITQSGTLRMDVEDVPSIERIRYPLFIYYSMKLPDIVKLTNYHSNNMIAEHIFKYLSLQKAKQGNFKDAIEVVKEYWYSKGLDVSKLDIYDGSGLTKDNKFSAEFLNRMLIYMAKTSKHSDTFFNSLPVAGVSGTVRNLLRNTSLSGKAYLKSGSMSGVQCYAGYIVRDSKKYSMVVMVNDFRGNRHKTVQKIEKMILHEINQYEQQ